MKTLNKNHWTIFSILLLTLGGLWIWFTKADPAETMQNQLSAPQVGFQAPDFYLSTLDGEEVQLSDYRGSPVLLNFWASWCPPCRAEMADMQRVFDRYKAQGFRVLAVNSTSKDNLNDVSHFSAEYGLTFPVPLDIFGDVSDSYQIRLLPTSFFVNRDGIITKIILGGPMRAPTIEKNLKPLIEEGK